jgi:hypothetical protein
MGSYSNWESRIGLWGAKRTLFLKKKFKNRLPNLIWKQVDNRFEYWNQVENKFKNWKCFENDFINWKWFQKMKMNLKNENEFEKWKWIWKMKMNLKNENELEYLYTFCWWLNLCRSCFKAKAKVLSFTRRACLNILCPHRAKMYD